MRTKYIGFVKTSFSSPSLPFRIEGIRPRKTDKSLPFSHLPRTSTLRSRRSRQRSEVAFRKSGHAHNARPFTSFILDLGHSTSPVLQSVKGRRTRLCEKSDRKQGEKRSTSPLFSLFLSVFFRKQRHPPTGFSRRRHQELLETEQMPLQKTASDHPLRKNTRR